MNILNSLKKYADGWKVIASRVFDKEEVEAISHAKIVASEYGNSCCFFLKEGGQVYIPMSRDSQGTVGDEVDFTTANILTLQRDGEEILRIEI